MKKQIKFLGVLAIALTLGLAACNGGGNDGGKSEDTQTSHKHSWGEWTVTKEATCTEDGVQERTCACGEKQTKTIKAAHKWGEWETVKEATCKEEGSAKRVCSVCKAEETKVLEKADHTWGDWVPVTEATCTEAGSRKHICSVCQTEELEAVEALGHDWADAEDQSTAVAPTCTEAGTKIQECSRCHVKQEVAVEALGHDFPAEGRELEIPAATEKNTKGEIPFHWAKITNYSCTRGDSYRYAWSAKEVNFDYKNVAEGAEPELLDEGEDGIRFWGRPIGNAMVLDENGTASGNDAEKIPDESVKGSRFEFDFVFDTDVNDVCLSADLTPAQYTNDIFKNRSGDQEWTPGYRFKDVTDPETGVVTREAEMIEGMRYIIYLDGVEVELDSSVNTRPNGRGWYQFPCKLNLTAGKHNLNIAMAGGYRHTFYSFSFEKVAPAHDHNFGTGTAQTDEVESTIATCVKNDATMIKWSAKKFNAEASVVGTPNSEENGSSGIKFGGSVYNKTANAAPNEGDHAVYNVNVPTAQTEAQLLMRFNRKDKVSAFSAPSGDQSPSYVLDPATNQTTSTKYSWRYKLFVNDVEVEFTPYASGEEPQTVAKTEVEYAFPCKLALNAGVNKIELQKWGGYTATIVDFSLVY